MLEALPRDCRGHRVLVSVVNHQGDGFLYQVTGVVVGVTLSDASGDLDELGVHFHEHGEKLHNDWKVGCGYRTVYRGALEHARRTAAQG